MRADYDSRGDTLQITLADADAADYGDDSTPGVVVAVRNGAAVNIDLLDASAPSALEALASAGVRYGVDPKILIAAARSALELPDRTVVLDVLGRDAA
jgi:hypothetical protein